MQLTTFPMTLCDYGAHINPLGPHGYIDAADSPSWCSLGQRVPGGAVGWDVLVAAEVAGAAAVPVLMDVVAAAAAARCMDSPIMGTFGHLSA
jgi:hypothetical protein